MGVQIDDLGVLTRLLYEQLQPVGHPVFGSGQEVPLAVEHHRHRGVAGPSGDLGRAATSGDPERHGGVPQIVDPQRV